MNRADEIRDQIRQMRYLSEEKKFIDDMIRKLNDQKNRLLLEQMSIRRLINNQKSAEEEVADGSTEAVAEVDNTFFSYGTPSRPIEESIVNCNPIDNQMNGRQPKAVAEAIELDVSQVLLRLASGGAQDIPEEEEEDDEDEDILI